MITECSHCGTKFEISRDLVESEDPRVRCGECLNVFNARVQLVAEGSFLEPEIPTVTQKADRAEPAAAVTATELELATELEGFVSADDLENAATIMLDEPAQSRPSAPAATGGNDGFYSPDLQLDMAGPNGRTTDASTEFEQTLLLDSNSSAPAVDPSIDTDAAIDSVTNLDVARDSSHDPAQVQTPLNESKFEERGRTRASDAKRHSNDSAAELRRHLGQRGGKVLPIDMEERSHRPQQKSMLLPLTCVLLALAASLYFARDRVAQLDLPEPVLTAFCGVAGCELPLAQDLTRLELLQHRMNIHSRRDDVLVINVDMINNASFRQPYPVLAVTMTDTNGEIVAERRFQPVDYLDPASPEATLPSKEPVRIRFEILDPGPEAVSSELEFE